MREILGNPCNTIYITAFFEYLLKVLNNLFLLNNKNETHRNDKLISSF